MLHAVKIDWKYPLQIEIKTLTYKISNEKYQKTAEKVQNVHLKTFRHSRNDVVSLKTATP